MKYSLKIFSSILAILTITSASWFYSRPTSQGSTNNLRNLATSLVTTKRLALLDTTCSGYKRSQLQSSDDASRSSHIESVNAAVGIDGITVVRLYVNKNEQMAKQKIQENQGSYVGYGLPFLIGLILLVIATPFFITFIACPEHCPPHKCYRKKDQQQFQQGELFYPVVALIIVLVAVVICALYGLIATSGDRDSYQRTSCSTSILFDDGLNGNTSSLGYYFVGLNSLAKVLTQLQANMTNIDSNFSMLYSNDSTATINKAITQTQTAMNDTIKISNNDMVGSNLTLNYATPLDSTTPTGSINSMFPTLLGSYSAKTGYVYVLYTALNTLYQVIFAVKNNATTIHNTLSSIQSQLTTAISNATLATNEAKSNVETASPYVQSVSSGGAALGAVFIVYFVLLLIGCIVCGIAVFFIFKYRSSRCRYVVYVLCVVLFLLAVFGFVIAGIISLILPPYAWTCNFSDQTLSNSYYFQYNLQNVFEQQTLKQMETCMPFSNGDLVPQIGGTQLAANFDILRGLFNTLSSFNASFYMSPITLAMTTSTTVISSYALTQILDITDTSSLSILAGLTTCNLFSYPTCNTICSMDSWVPSNGGLVFPCTSFSSNRGNAATCSSGVATTAGGCSGCMDTTQALHRYVSLATLLSDLSLRYGVACTFNVKLYNVWNNYYKVKDIALGPTVNGVASTSGVYPRTMTVSSDVTTLTSTIAVGITTVFANVNANLNSISDLINPTYGILSSLNCQVIGQDITRTMNVACGTAFTHTYNVRIITGVISYFLLAALFFVVCVISKNSRMSEPSLVSPDSAGRKVANKGSFDFKEEQQMEEKDPKFQDQGQEQMTHTHQAPEFFNNIGISATKIGEK